MTDIPDEIMQRARAILPDIAHWPIDCEHNELVIAHAIMETEARGFERGLEALGDMAYAEGYAAAREQAATKIEDAGGSMAEYYAGLIRAMEMSDE